MHERDCDFLSVEITTSLVNFSTVEQLEVILGIEVFKSWKELWNTNEKFLGTKTEA
jgi:hypothetical protein